MRRCGLRRRATARGAAAVEFALILPILLLLVFGIINYGDMLSVRQSVSQAAAEGARAAAVAQSDKAGAAQAAVDAALQRSSCTWSSDGCTVVTDDDCDDTDANTTCARVTVDIDYDPLIPGFGLVLPDNLTYTAVARVS